MRNFSIGIREQFCSNNLTTGLKTFVLVALTTKSSRDDLSDAKKSCYFRLFQAPEDLLSTTMKLKEKSKILI